MNVTNKSFRTLNNNNNNKNIIDRTSNNTITATATTSHINSRNQNRRTNKSNIVNSKSIVGNNNNQDNYNNNTNNNSDNKLLNLYSISEKAVSIVNSSGENNRQSIISVDLRNNTYSKSRNTTQMTRQSGNSIDELAIDAAAYASDPSVHLKVNSLRSVMVLLSRFGIYAASPSLLILTLAFSVMNLQMNLSISYTIAYVLMNLVSLSMAFNNTYRTLNIRYTKKWQEYYQKMLRNAKGKTPDISVIKNSKTEAFYMSIAFNSALYFLLNIIFNYFVLANFSQNLRLHVSNVLSCGLMYFLSR